MISPELLRRYPYFTGVSEESLKKIAMASEEMTCEKGETLFEDDEPADTLYVITKGEVDIVFLMQGGERRTVDTLVAGDLVLWSALVEPFRTTASCIARIQTSLLAIDGTTLRQLANEDRDLGYHLFKEITKVTSHRLAGARIQIAALS